MEFNQKGFTLIELMIVVTIIGILAAIALPAYESYTTKSKITEGMRLSAPVMNAVAQMHATGLPSAGTNASFGVAPSSTISGNHVTSVLVDNTGTVTVTFNALGGFIPAGQQITLSPSFNGGSTSWQCSASNPAVLANRLLPTHCRS